jgi:hypothetical protein
MLVKQNEVEKIKKMLENKVFLVHEIDHVENNRYI